MPDENAQPTALPHASSFLAFGTLRWLLLPGAAHLLDERSESLGDGLIAVAGDMLVDHRRANAGVPDSCHQLFERGGTQSPGQRMALEP